MAEDKTNDEKQLKFTTVLLEEASCLSASSHVNKVEPVTISIVQPKGGLIRTKDLGPHYSKEDEEDEKYACERVTSFLQKNKENKNQLVVAPEYFTPLSFFSEHFIKTPKTLLHENSLYILPLECITGEDFNDLLRKFEKNDTWETRSAKFVNEVKGNNNAEKYFINTCAIIIITEEKEEEEEEEEEKKKHIFFQHKFFRSQIEETCFRPGREVFVFCGKHYFLMNFICSDLNDCSAYLDSNEAAFRKPGGFITHVQWNPCPDFQSYQTFRSIVFDNVLGQYRYVISVNWAPGSTISKNSEKTINLTRSLPRIYSCSGKNPYPFEREHGLRGITYEARHYGPHNQLMTLHFLHTRECIYDVHLVKPVECVSKPLATRTWLLKESRTWESSAADGNFKEWKDTKVVTKPFWFCLEKIAEFNGLDDRDKAMSYPVLEEFCASCFLLESPEVSHLSNALARIPSAPILCSYCTEHVQYSRCEDEDFKKSCPNCCANLYPDCAQMKQRWIRDMEYIKDSFVVFKKKGFRDWQLVTDDEKKEKEIQYPVNCFKNIPRKQGILFNGRGQSCVNLCDVLDQLLNKKYKVIDGANGLKEFCLFAAGVPGPFDTESLLSKWNSTRQQYVIHKPRSDHKHHICNSGGASHNLFNRVTITVEKLDKCS